ncbi:MAG: hypothetical protein RR382_01855 [Tannerellaceae bacterium]
MKTKKEVIDWVKSELACGNKVIIASIGQGGAGLTYADNDDLVDELTVMVFNGQPEVICDDIAECKDLEEGEYEVYEFKEQGNPFIYQIAVY